MRRKNFIEFICLMLFFLILFTPRSFEKLPLTSAIYNKMFPVHCLVLLVAIVLSATVGFRNLKNLIVPGAAVFILSSLMICFLHGGDYKLFFRATVHLLAVLILVSYEFYRKDNCFLEACAWYFTVILVINLFFLIIKPDGLATFATYSKDNAYRQIDRLNFIEVDNRLSLPVLISIATAYMLPDKRINKVLRIVALIVGGATNIFTMSGTGLGSFFVMMIYVLTIHKSKIRSKIVNMKTILAAYFVCMLLIVYAGMIPPLAALIQNVLHKDLTFSGRTEIWQLCIEMISKHPIIGYGNFESGWIITWHGIDRNAHNLFFDILIQGGIVMLGGYLVMLFTVFKTAIDHKDKRSGLLLILYFTLFVVLLCESFLDNCYVFLAFSLAIAGYFKQSERNALLKRIKAIALPEK